MDKFLDLTGQIISLENGNRFFLSEHCIAYSDDGYVDRKPVSCKGFFYRPNVVNGFREVSKGLFGLKKIHYFDKEVNLYDEMDYYSFNNLRGEESEPLVIRTPDNFPYKVGQLANFRGGPRVVLGMDYIKEMDYIDLLGFKINFSEIIEGDDLEYFASDGDLLLFAGRSNFIKTLFIQERVIVSALDFRVDEWGIEYFQPAQRSWAGFLFLKLL